MYSAEVVCEWSSGCRSAEDRLDLKFVHFVCQNLIPTNKPNAEPKRPGRPVNITHLCYLSASVVNNIVVSWNVEKDRVCATSLLH